MRLLQLWKPIILVSAALTVMCAASLIFLQFVLIPNIGIDYSKERSDKIFTAIFNAPMPVKGVRMRAYGHAFGEADQAWLTIDGDGGTINEITSSCTKISQSDFVDDTPLVPKTTSGLLGKLNSDARKAGWDRIHEIRNPIFFRINFQPPKPYGFIRGTAVEDPEARRLYVSVQG